jgi:putative tryptophan/tyrosine transport system substrate-binding protein
MRRREFIGGFVGNSILLPRTSRAQLPPTPRRIAIVAPSSSIEVLRTNPIYRAFLDELARLGFNEGQNLVVDRYSGNGHMESYPELARTVVNSNPEAILTSAGPMTLALRTAT